LEPERYVQLSRIRERLHRALQTLPARHRHIIRLHDFEEWTLKRIGEKLGVNESRVSQLRSQALRRLRAELIACESEL
jgi:RNA polymerase sigma factor for flagellar operon FliA